MLRFCCSKPTSFCDFGVSFLHYYFYLFGRGVGFLHQSAFFGIANLRHFGILVYDSYTMFLYRF